MRRFLTFFSILFCTLHPPIQSVEFIHHKDYATHQPVLYEVAMNTSGPIIEFGCGEGSTDLLHEICEAQGRVLISIDDDLNWLSRFSKKYLGKGYEVDNSGWHKFYFVPGKNRDDHENPQHWVNFLNTFELLKTMTFDLCFIDQSPWLARYETLLRLRDISRFVIVHDCDYFAHQGIFGKAIIPHDESTYHPGIYDFSDVLRYSKVYYPQAPWPLFSGPPTLLGSELEPDLPHVDYNNY